MISFWKNLPRPIIGLSPMDGVTDHPFRHIQKRHGNPDLLFTEFVRVERLCAGEMKLLRALLYDESQRPIIAQVYGTKPEAFRQAAVLLCRLGFDGIDINMGCPSPNVADSGAGAGLILTPDLAVAIVAATRAGVRDWQNGATAWELPGVAPCVATLVEDRHAGLPPEFQQHRPVPVSTKTRIGYANTQVDEWIPRLLESQPAAISLHGRTLIQGYTGTADWAAIGRAGELARGSGTLLLGNGDVAHRGDGLARAAEYGVDGVLIGRASYGNPFVFCTGADKIKESSQEMERRLVRLLIAGEHAAIYEESLCGWSGYSFNFLHKHLRWYVRGLPGARHLRGELVRTSSAAEVAHLLDGYLTQQAPPIQQSSAD